MGSITHNYNFSLYAKMLKLKKFGIDIGDENLPVRLRSFEIRGIVWRFLKLTCEQNPLVRGSITPETGVRFPVGSPLIIPRLSEIL